MGCDILRNEDDTQAVFFCNTTDWAFGPVMYVIAEYDDSAYETAEAFLKWLKRDPRSFGDDELAAKWSAFVTNAEARAKYTKADHDADVADMKHSDGET